MMKIIPVFLPQDKCQHNCIFCNQSTTVGEVKHLSKEDIRKTIEASLNTIPENTDTQLAFYGGSFTLLPHSTMMDYLETIELFIKQNLIHSIRISTRPDGITEDILDILQSYSVNLVELGVQILDDDILYELQRGHTVNDVENAVALLKKYNMETSLQLMVGLPGETDIIRDASFDKVIALKPEFLRIHPTIVLRGSELEQMFNNKKYQPLSLKESIEIISKMLIKAELNNIKLLRIGLQSSTSLQEEGSIIAGPWHPSLGQMVKSEVYFNLLQKLFEQHPELSQQKELNIIVNNREISNFTGLRKHNIKKLRKLYPYIKLLVNHNNNLHKYEISTLIKGKNIRVGLSDLI